MRPLAPRCEVMNSTWPGAVPLQKGGAPRAGQPLARRPGVLREAICGLPIALAAGLLIPLCLQAVGNTTVRRASPTNSVAQSLRLGLTALPDAGRLILSWNWEAESIKVANKAMLFITDGGRREVTELDLSVLRGKKLAYSPLSNDVSFQLTVGGSEDGNLESESVRVIAPRGFPRSPGVP